MKIKTLSKIQILFMAFSRQATWLMIIGNRPDFKIQIYDLEKWKMLSIEEELRDKDLVTASFNPSNHD